MVKVLDLFVNIFVDIFYDIIDFFNFVDDILISFIYFYADYLHIDYWSTDYGVFVENYTDYCVVDDFYYTNHDIIVDINCTYYYSIVDIDCTDYSFFDIYYTDYCSK